MDASKVKLAIALPHTDKMMAAEFVDSFFCMARQISMVYVRPKGNGTIDFIRNQLVDQALAQDATHIWMVDTDQVYPQETLVKLLSHDLDIVGCKIHRRWPPYEPILYRFNGEWPNLQMVPDDEWMKGGLVEVDATGTGSILIKMDVFKRLARPWFLMNLYNDPPIGEDIHFCKTAKDAGYKIFVDCDIKVGHLANVVIDEAVYLAFKNMPKGPPRISNK